MRVKDADKFKEALEKLGEELRKQAENIIEIANLQIEMREKALEPIRKSIQNINSEIGRLQGLKAKTAGAFGEAISSITGAFKSPGQSVADLQAQFAAATGEEKGAIGERLASALQTQFESARELAAQGAISGEELQTIQQDVLRQLQAADVSAQSEFDRLISMQELQLEQLKVQEASIVAEIEALKEEAVKQIDKLDEILKAIESGDVEKIAQIFLDAQEAGIKRSIGFILDAFPKFASGTSYVPNTGLAMVHQGEAIIPRNKNTGGGITININGVSASGANKESLTQAVREILIQNIGNFRGAVQRATR
jgi:DNA repair exonuclease SbcCD ATPase subunit